MLIVVVALSAAAVFKQEFIISHQNSKLLEDLCNLMGLSNRTAP
jgi:hypothetical protein